MGEKEDMQEEEQEEQPQPEQPQPEQPVRQQPDVAEVAEPPVKKRGRPRKAPEAPKPEPKKRGRPPKPAPPAPEPATSATPRAPLDLYNREMMQALIAHSRTSILQKEDRWGRLVKF